MFGFWFYGIPAVWIHKFVSSVAFSNLVGFLVVFFACTSLGGLIGKLLSKLFKWTGLSWLDRLMGAGFGLVRGSLMAVAFVSVLMAFTPRPVPAWMTGSFLLPYAIDTSNVLASLAPRALKDPVREYGSARSARRGTTRFGRARSARRSGTTSRITSRAQIAAAQGRESVSHDLFVFDLDGTLVDSQSDLTAAVNATRAWMGLEPLPAENVARYVGNGAPVLVQRALPDAGEEDWSRGLKYFLEYYREHMLDSTRLYPGVREALDELHRAGIPLAVLTNKPIRFSLQMLEGLGLDLHFFRVYGGNSFPEKKPHPMGLDALIAEARADRDRTVMVGDSAVDVQTARNAGVRACGVRWGFQPETFVCLASGFPDRRYAGVDWENGLGRFGQAPGCPRSPR